MIAYFINLYIINILLIMANFAFIRMEIFIRINNLEIIGELIMTVLRIGIMKEVYDDLVDYKNKKALLNKKSKYSFTDAIRDLLEDSKTLSEWMKEKK